MLCSCVRALVRGAWGVRALRACSCVFSDEPETEAMLWREGGGGGGWELAVVELEVVAAVAVAVVDSQERRTDWMGRACDGGGGRLGLW